MVNVIPYPLTGEFYLTNSCFLDGNHTGSPVIMSASSKSSQFAINDLLANVIVNVI